MQKFLGVMGLGAALALVGCDQGADVAPQPSSTGSPQPAGPGPDAGPAAASSEAATSPGAAAIAGPGALTPENTKIEFVGTKKGGQHVGGFAKFSGRIEPAQDDFAKSKLTVEIDTESLHADDPKLTNHLKAPDFFEVRKYPKASFASTSIQESKEGDATHAITGDLTLHGTTKSITIPAKVTQEGDTLTLDSTFTIDRLDYGMAFNPQMVDPTVTIKVSAKVDRK